MSLDNSFYISTSKAPENLMRIFLLSLGIQPDPDNPCAIYAPHFNAGVGPLEGLSREIMNEGLGFEPDQYFTFRTWAAASIASEREIVRGTLAICRALEGDAALLFNGEIILFLRKAGVLYLNSAYWRGNYSLFTPPYEIKEFKVL